MSQAAVILPGSPLTGAAAAADMNAAWAAMISMFSGNSAPTLGPGPSGALVFGQDWLNTSVTPPVWNKWDGTQWVAVASFDNVNHVLSPSSAPLSWRNLAGDNGGFEVWQRGAGSSASFSVAASSTVYTADRWYLLTGANQASTVAAVAGLLSNLAAKVQRNNGQTGTTLMQISFPFDTDEIVKMRGNNITVSFAAKAGGNWSPASGILGVFLATSAAVGPSKRGNGYASEVVVINASTPLTTLIKSFSFVSNITVPSLTTAAELILFWTPVGTAGTDDSFTVDNVQVEIGTFATAYEQPPFEKMLLGCKRHFWKSFLYGTAPAQNVGISTGELFAIAGVASTGAEWILARNPVSMRATPAVITFNPAASNAQVRDETQAADCSATSVNSETSEHFNITATGNASTAVGHVLGVHAIVDAGI